MKPLPSSPLLFRCLLKPCALTLLAWWLSLHYAAAFSVLSSNQLVFVNLDHAPMGACSTITYGYKDNTCGVGTSTGVYPVNY